ncbi:hypothetical protein ACLI09_17685 [Flavobacterium sp. RHBU_24]|uniref:hypothetical protein n=1 Tax=Flavobacterium sp. RHBU_24 TaxID=3391185 RepID=UPI00398549B6
MKNIKLISFFLLLLTSMGLTSCDTEPIDQNIVNQNPDDDGGGDDDGGDDDGGDDDGGSTSGDYWPFALNNQWQFESSEPQNDSPMKIIGTETIEGTQYYRVNHFFQASGTDSQTGTAIVLLRKDGNTWYERVQVNLPSNEGLEINTSPYELPILKDLAVGQTWTHSTAQITSYESDPDFPIEIPDVVTDIDIEGTVLEKGVSATVNGTAYTDVIKIRFDQVFTTYPGEGFPDVVTTTSTEIWFAKNIGPIRSETTLDTGTSLTELVSYIVN